MSAGTAYDINSSNATANHTQCGGFMFEIRAKTNMKILNFYYQHWSTSSGSQPILVELYRYHGTGSCPGRIIGQNLLLNNNVPYEVSPTLWTRVGGSAVGQSQTVSQPNGYTAVFATNASTHTFDPSTSTYSISNNSNAGEEARHICAGETATFYINGVSTRLAVGPLLTTPAMYVSTPEMDVGWCSRLHHGSPSVGTWSPGDPIVLATGGNSSPYGQPFINNSSYGFTTGPNATNVAYCQPSYLRVEAQTMV